MNDKAKNFLSTRNGVAIGGGVILGLIGLMGITMGWSLYEKSFSTYSKFPRNLFSLGTAAVIEASLVWFGVQLIKAASTGWERLWAIISASVILIIIALNISTHNASVRGAELSGWQFDYITYFGPAVIVVIAALVIVQLLSRPETKAEFRNSMRDFEVKERIDKIEDDILASDDFDKWMKETFRGEIYQKAARRAGYDPDRHQLPAAAPPALPAIPVAPPVQPPQQSFQPPTVDAQVVEVPEPPRTVPWMPATIARAIGQFGRNGRNGQNGTNGAHHPNGQRH